MAGKYPKLRADLEIRPESTASGSPILVKDPVLKRFYRFTAVQGAALRRLDGERSPREIAGEVTAECATAVEEAEIEEFASRLEKLALLDTGGSWAKLEAAKRGQRSPLRNVLAIKVRAFNPDSLLTRLEPRLTFCFSRGFVVLALGSIAAAASLSILNWEELSSSIADLFRLESVPLLLAGGLTVTILHELAHGLTLKHFGGKVEEMGFLLLYFLPAFYCNVDDAWLLEKRKRVWVTLAGGFIQLFVWSLAIFGWRLLSPETLPSRFLAAVIAFSGAQTLLNFTPLIRLDGYYLLSDLLEVPNLRPKAFRFLREQAARRLLGTGPGAASPATARERRLFWIYGSAALLFSGALIWSAVMAIGGWLVAEYQAWGLVLVSAAMIASVQIAGKESVQPIRVLAALAERVRRTPRFLIVACIAAGGTLLPWELKISGDFTVKPAERTSVSAQVDGTLRAVFADEGKQVKRGDVLAEIENLELARDLQETRGELATKMASLRLLEAGTRPEEIARARKQLETRRVELANASRIAAERASLAETVKKREVELANAREVYERHQRLALSGLISKNDLDRERTNFEVRSRELSEAQGSLKVLEEKTERALAVKRTEVDEAQSLVDLLRAGSRREAIDESRAEVDRLVEKAKNLERQLEYLKVRSTIDGVVATPYLSNRVGEYVSKGDFFCEVVNPSLMWADMPVPEKEIADVERGYPITLKVRGFPNLAFEGRVATISPVALESGTVRKVLVRSELANSSGVLKSGMTGVGKIHCGKRMIANLLSRRMIRWLRTEFWEYLP